MKLLVLDEADAEAIAAANWYEAPCSLEQTWGLIVR